MKYYICILPHKVKSLSKRTSFALHERLSLHEGRSLTLHEVLPLHEGWPLVVSHEVLPLHERWSLHINELLSSYERISLDISVPRHRFHIFYKIISNLIGFRFFSRKIWIFWVNFLHCFKLFVSNFTQGDEDERNIFMFVSNPRPDGQNALSLKLCKHLGNIKPFKPIKSHLIFTQNILKAYSSCLFTICTYQDYRGDQAYLDNSEPHNPSQ